MSAAFKKSAPAKAPPRDSGIFRRAKDDDIADVVMFRPNSTDSILNPDPDLDQRYSLRQTNARIAFYSECKELRSAAVRALSETWSAYTLLHVCHHSDFPDTRIEAANELAALFLPGSSQVDLEVLSAIACRASSSFCRQTATRLILSAAAGNIEVSEKNQTVQGAMFNLAFRNSHFDSLNSVIDHFLYGFGIMMIPAKIFAIAVSYLFFRPFVAFFDLMTTNTPSIYDQHPPE